MFRGIRYGKDGCVQGVEQAERDAEEVRRKSHIEREEWMLEHPCLVEIGPKRPTQHPIPLSLDKITATTLEPSSNINIPAQDNVNTLNQLVSRSLKAKMKGDMDTFHKLEKEIAQIRSEESKGKARAKRQKTSRFVNSKQTIEDLIREERHSSGRDVQVQFVRSTAKLGKSTDLDEQFDRASSSMFDSSSYGRAVSSYIPSDCILCHPSEGMLVYRGTEVYLGIPKEAVFAQDQCILVPFVHASSSVEMQESARFELDQWKNSISKMYQSLGKSVVFLETVLSKGMNKHHSFIECVGLPSEAGQDAPLFFQQALQEVGSEWRSNVKVIKTSRQTKPLYTCIPKGFPFFHVEFDNGQGFAHVIEDDEFPREFGKQVLCSILDEPAQLLLSGRRNTESLDSQILRCNQLKTLFKPFQNPQHDETV